MLCYYLSRRCAHVVLASSSMQGGELPVTGPVFSGTFSELGISCLRGEILPSLYGL